jgi:hypothetical protein
MAALWTTTGQIPFESPITDTSFTTSKGANSIASGDLLVIVAGLGDQTGTGTNPGAFTMGSSGFTNAIDVAAGSTGNNIRGGLFWKIAGGSETGAYTIGLGSSNPWGWAMINFGPHASPADAGPANTPLSGFSFVTCPAVSPTNSTDTVIAAIVVVGGTAKTTPTTYTRNITLIDTGTYTNEPSIHVASKQPIGATGSTGAINWGAGPDTTNSGIMMTIAFTPNGGGGGAIRHNIAMLGVG